MYVWFALIRYYFIKMQPQNILLTKYKQKKSFQNQMDEGKINYDKIVQQALYCNLASIPDNILQKFYSNEIQIYFYYGFLQPSKPSELNKLMMYFFKNFNPKDRPYVFVFFNNQTQSNQYNSFREIFLMLTINHFVHLKQFVVVKSSFMTRAFQYMTFGALNQYLKEKTVFISNASELCARYKIQPQKFIDFVPEKIYQSEKSCFPYYEKKPININDYRINLEGQQMSLQEKQLRNKQQHQLLSLMTKHGKQTHKLQDYELSEIGIPIVLKMLTYYFTNNPSGLLLQGIFRKSVSIDQENETLKQLNLKNYQCLETITNPHIIANLIKRFFSKLLVPVIPFEQFSLLMHDQGITDKNTHVKNIIQTLPQLNLLTLVHLLTFIKQQVLPKESSNKMNIMNLSICFSPCLMRAKQISQADLIYASKSVQVMKILLNNFDNIFGDRKNVKNLYRKSYIKHKKSIRDTIQHIFNQNFQESKQNPSSIPKLLPVVEVSSQIYQDSQDSQSEKQKEQILVQKTKQQQKQQHIKSVIQLNQKKTQNHQQKIQKPKSFIKNNTKTTSQPISIQHLQNKQKQYASGENSKYKSQLNEHCQIIHLSQDQQILEEQIPIISVGNFIGNEFRSKMLSKMNQKHNKESQ